MVISFRSLCQTPCLSMGPQSYRKEIASGGLQNILGQWQFLYTDCQQLSNVLHKSVSFISNVIETLPEFCHNYRPNAGTWNFLLNVRFQMSRKDAVETSTTWLLRSCPIAVTCNITNSYCHGVFHNYIGSTGRPLFSPWRYGTWNKRSSWNRPLAICNLQHKSLSEDCEDIKVLDINHTITSEIPLKLSLVFSYFLALPNVLICYWICICKTL